MIPVVTCVTIIMHSTHPRIRKSTHTHNTKTELLTYSLGPEWVRSFGKFSIVGIGSYPLCEARISPNLRFFSTKELLFVLFRQKMQSVQGFGADKMFLSSWSGCRDHVWCTFSPYWSSGSHSWRLLQMANQVLTAKSIAKLFGQLSCVAFAGRTCCHWQAQTQRIS